MDLTKRAKVLRDNMLKMPEVCVERAYYMTQSYKETEGQPNAIRRAKGLQKILREMSIRIEDGEVIVGWPTSKVRGVALLPEVNAGWILDEMDTLEDREWDKYAAMSEEDKNTLREVIPYWNGKSMGDQWQNAVPEEAAELEHIIQSSGGFAKNGHHMCHVAPDYAKLLSCGIASIRTEVEAKLAALDLSVMGEMDKYHWYKSVLICYDAVLEFADRYADLAAELAKKESNAQRRAELEKISEVCRNVPRKPACSFREAIQSIWFLFLTCMIEAWGAGMSLGRVDQYLYPYYINDINNGVITEEEAHELLCLLLIKMNGVVNPQSEVVSTFLGGYPVMQGLTLGGVTREGKDAVNELSYLFLEAERNVGLSAEDLVIRVSNANPAEFMIKSCEVAKALRGKLKFVSDTTTIQSMLYNGLSPEDARDYISTGCHNPTVPALSHDIGGVTFNYALIMELALNNGVSRMTGKRIGPETGDPINFKSMDDVMDAFYKQFEAVMQYAFLYKNVDMQLFSQIPVPLVSSFYPPCLESGHDMYDGGTPYMTHTTSLGGAPNIGDSLAAIKKVVFEDKKITMSQLIDALDNNFEGAEDIRYMLSKAPKFGNDDDYVDDLVREVVYRASSYVEKHKTFRGRKSRTAAVAMTANIPLGSMVGALPDGRKAGEPLSEGGISPYQGRNVSGVTATLRSIAKLDQVKLTNGSILNVRISSDAFKDADKIKVFAEMVKTYCAIGGNLVQFNFASNKTLRDAQAHPENYRDMLVRVATYSAYFVELSPNLQDDIISRTEFEEL